MNTFENDLHRFYHELGWLMHAFSLVEYQLFNVLKNCTEVDDTVARAIFSGTRSDVAISHVRRVYRAKSKDLPVALESALIQFKKINSDRNVIIHYGLNFQEAPWEASNWWSSMPDQPEKKAPCSPDTLEKMRRDAITIYHTLQVYAAESNIKYDLENENLLARQHQKSAQGAWLYK